MEPRDPGLEGRSRQLVIRWTKKLIGITWVAQAAVNAQRTARNVPINRPLLSEQVPLVVAEGTGSF